VTALQLLGVASAHDSMAVEGEVGILRHGLWKGFIRL
jgi:hypothetical protein